MLQSSTMKATNILTFTALVGVAFASAVPPSTGQVRSSSLSKCGCFSIGVLPQQADACFSLSTLCLARLLLVMWLVRLPYFESRSRFAVVQLAAPHSGGRALCKRRKDPTSSTDDSYRASALNGRPALASMLSLLSAAFTNTSGSHLRLCVILRLISIPSRSASTSLAEFRPCGVHY